MATKGSCSVSVSVSVSSSSEPSSVSSSVWCSVSVCAWESCCTVAVCAMVCTGVGKWFEQFLLLFVELLLLGDGILDGLLLSLAVLLVLLLLGLHELLALGLGIFEGLLLSLADFLDLLERWAVCAVWSVSEVVTAVSSELCCWVAVASCEWSEGHVC